MSGLQSHVHPARGGDLDRLVSLVGVVFQILVFRGQNSPDTQDQPADLVALGTSAALSFWYASRSVTATATTNGPATMPTRPTK